MKLPIPLPFGNKEKSEYFLTLILRDEKASAIILKEVEGKVQVVSKHDEQFQTSLETATDEEWLHIFDKTISKAEEMLPPDVETQKTVFGVKETWVDEKRIKKEYLLKLKKVCDALRLSPVGFLVIPEAITHLIREEEGAPVSAILCEIGQKSASIYLVRAGHIVDSKTGPIHETPARTIEWLLKQFTDVEVLPSRIVVFNGHKDQELMQEFIAYQWSKSIPFLHVPQISVLPVGFDAKAVVFGAATQMGFEVVGPLSSNTMDIKTIDNSTHDEKHRPTKDEEKEIVASDNEQPEDVFATIPDGEDETDIGEDADEPTDLASVPADNFGFVMEKDITSLPHKRSETKEEDDKTDLDEEKEHAGPKIHHYTEDMRKEENLQENDDTGEEDGEEAEEHARSRRNRNNPVAGLLAGLGGMSKINPFKHMPSFSFPGKGGKLFIILPIVIIVLIGLLLLYLFSLRATITLTVKPKVIEQDENMLFSATSPNDFANNTIAAKEVTITQSGSESTDATGKKEVGNKAKGTITVYNSGESTKTLSAGSVVSSSNNLDFVTDKDITIASASGDIFSGIKSGTAQVSVTAKNIGTEYNLPSATKFSVSGSTSLAAKNDSAFSGGTKKTVTVVAKKDLDTLSEKLPDSLIDKAKSDAQNQVGGDEALLATAIDQTLSKKSYDRNVDDETKTVTLKADVTYTFLSYQKNDLISYAQSIIKSHYSNDLTIADNGIKNTINDLKAKSDKEASASLHISASLLPKISRDQVQQDLAGKSFSQAEDYLSKLPQVASAQIQLSPPIPLLQLLPRMSKNITLIIQTHE